LAKADAQENTTELFFAKSLTEPFSKTDKKYPLVMAKQTVGDTVRFRIYNPTTEKLLFTMRCKKISYRPAAKGRKNTPTGLINSGFIPDSSFSYLLKTDKLNDSTLVQFDASASALSYFNKEKQSVEKCIYTVTKEDTSTTIINYYANGKIQRNCLYKNTLIQLDFFTKGYYLTFLKQLFQLSTRDGLPHKDAYFYPNGTAYYAFQENNKRRIKAFNDYSEVKMQDSLGKTLPDSLYWDKVARKQIGYWRSFFANGRINTEYYYSTDTLKYNATTTYDEKTGLLLGRMFDTDNLSSKKAYIQRENYHFREEPSYYYSESGHSYTYSKTTIATPLFSIELDSLGGYTRQNIVASGSWSKNTCPPKPHFIVAMTMKDGLLEGNCRIYSPDSSENKPILLLDANFKQGLLDGEAVVFNEHQKKVFHADYENGWVLKTEFSDPNMGGSKLKPLRAFAQYLIKSQEEINSRNKHDEQHAAYISKQAAFWERDTLLLLQDASEIQTLEDLKKGIVKIAQTQLTPDENSLVHLVYTKEYNGIKTDLFYYKKTRWLDSVVVERESYNKSLKINDLRKKIEYHFTEGICQPEQTIEPNDSVTIRIKYGDSSLTKKISMTVDSFAYPIGYKGLKQRCGAWQMRLHSNLTAYQDSLKAWLPRMIKGASMKGDKWFELYQLETPPFNITETLETNYPLYVHYEYTFDSLGRVNGRRRGDDYTPLLPDGKPDTTLALLDSIYKNGVYTFHDEEKNYTYRYKNNKQHGWQTETDIKNGFTDSRLYTNNKLLNSIVNKPEEHWRVYEIIDTTKQTMTTYTQKKGEKETERTVVYETAIDKNSWKISPDTSFVLREVYNLPDSLPAYLSEQYKIISPFTSLYTFFYPSGAIMEQRRYTVQDTITIERNDMIIYDAITTKPSSYTIQPKCTEQKINYSENGKINRLSNNFGQFEYSYDDAGKPNIYRLLGISLVLRK
jgi:antitoxin component YwqK of YwqJK toxin-antitoxin module